MSSNLYQRIYSLVKTIPKGKVASYKWIADKLKVSDYRIIGWALHRNPEPRNIPCHRVVKKDGRLANGYAFGGQKRQKELLKKEGIIFKGGKILKNFFIDH